MYEVKNHIFPLPKEIKENGEVKLGSISSIKVKIDIAGSGEIIKSAVKEIENAFLKIAAVYLCDDGYQISARFDKSLSCEDAYTIMVGDESAEITGFDEGGIFYGAVTLAKLLYTKGDFVFLPKVQIKDAPSLKTRGVFIESRHNEFMTLEDWKEIIDYCSRLKLNKMEVSIYGCWGCQFDMIHSWYLYVPIKSHPELSTPRTIKYYSQKSKGFVIEKDKLPTMFEEDFFGEAISYAKSKNIEMFPLFNSYGHNTLIPSKIPAVSAKDENGVPTMNGFCTESEETLNLLYEIYDEIIDRYLAPNGVTSFAIGMDEIQSVRGLDKNDIYKASSAFCQCERCRNKERSELTIDFIIRLIKYLKSRGMTSVYVYDDMLMKYGPIDEKFADRLKAEDIYDVTVIDWWNYSPNRKDAFRGYIDRVKSYTRSTVKSSTGYFHWTHYTEATNNIKFDARVAKENNFEGVINYTSFDYMYDFAFHYLADTAWSNEPLDEYEARKRYFNDQYPDNAMEAMNVWSKFGEIMTSCNYITHYITDILPHEYLGIKVGAEYPRCFVHDIAEVLCANKQLHMDVLTMFMCNCEEVFAYFKSESIADTPMNRAKLIAIENIKCYADTWLTLMKLHVSKDYDSSHAIREIRRLIRNFESHMLRVECDKMATYHPTTLRLLSRTRAYLKELLYKFEEASERDEKYEFNLCASQDRSDGFLFLG